MIANNYRKHPDALRYQRELFATGPRNSVAMRLLSAIADLRPDVPEWFKAKAAAAKALAKKVKAACLDWVEKSQCLDGIEWWTKKLEEGNAYSKNVARRQIEKLRQALVRSNSAN